MEINIRNKNRADLEIFKDLSHISVCPSPRFLANAEDQEADVQGLRMDFVDKSYSQVGS